VSKHEPQDSPVTLKASPEIMIVIDAAKNTLETPGSGVENSSARPSIPADVRPYFAKNSSTK
jgi:hypothetical protein